MAPLDGGHAQAREVRCLTLPHPRGTAALAASARGLCAIALVGGRRTLRERLTALGYSPGKLVPAPGDDPVLGSVRDWLDELLLRGRYDPPPALPERLPGTPFQKKVWRGPSRRFPPGKPGATVRSPGRSGAPGRRGPSGRRRRPTRFLPSSHVTASWEQAAASGATPAALR